jgi:hypothetical protein
MSTTVERKLIRALDRLSLLTVKTTRGELRRKALKQNRQKCFKLTFENFTYDETGVTHSGVNGAFVKRASWLAAIGKISRSISKTREYKIGRDLLDEFTKSTEAKILLNELVASLASKVLDRGTSKEIEEYSRGLVSTLIKRLKWEAVTFRAEVHLQGIAVLCDPIEFKLGQTEILLRRTNEADFQQVHPWHDFIRPRVLELVENHHSLPSAVLGIKANTPYPRHLDESVEQSITILRLFKVGSVEFIWWRSTPEYLVGLHGGRRHTKLPDALEQFAIGAADVERLKSFWQKMSEGLTATLPNLYASAITPLDVAYQRYSEALLTRGFVERRISTTVMGLESLFLKGGEKTEIAFRLRTRVARALGSIGYDPYAAKTSINDAYEVRSHYVHGDNLKAKSRRQIESRHESLDKLLRTVLDQLRVTMVVLIFTKLTKEDWIDLLDHSLIDDAKGLQLQEKLIPIKNITACV